MIRFIQIAALLAPVLGQSAYENQADFAWEINPVEGYPIIAFNQGNAGSEVVFKYDYAGSLADNKFLDIVLFQDDCQTEADYESLWFYDFMDGNQLQLDVDIIQARIKDSVHYSAPSYTEGNIAFCVRVDYKYEDAAGEVMSINFHETIVDITVDLTANFTLTSISTERTDAARNDANAKLDYPVVAFFCDHENLEIPAPIFAQGSAMQVCVKVDDTIVTEAVYVEDILRFVVSQPEGPAVPSVNIADGIPDPLTAKHCESPDGICNVKTQLPSKYFVEPFPNYLRVDGIALLAFGMADSSEPGLYGSEGGRDYWTENEADYPNDADNSWYPDGATANDVENLAAAESTGKDKNKGKNNNNKNNKGDSDSNDGRVRYLVARIQGTIDQSALNDRNLQEGSVGENPFALDNIALVSNVPKTKSSGGGDNTGVIVGVTVAVIVVIILAGAAIGAYFCYFSGNSNDSKGSHDMETDDEDERYAPPSNKYRDAV